MHKHGIYNGKNGVSKKQNDTNMLTCTINWI
jgi:hypothetical protein